MRTHSTTDTFGLTQSCSKTNVFLYNYMLQSDRSHYFTMSDTAREKIGYGLHTRTSQAALT